LPVVAVVVQAMVVAVELVDCLVLHPLHLRQQIILLLLVQVVQVR
jgi:hypothetical protein